MGRPIGQIKLNLESYAFASQSLIGIPSHKRELIPRLRLLNEFNFSVGIHPDKSLANDAIACGNLELGQLCRHARHAEDIVFEVCFWHGFGD